MGRPLRAMSVFDLDYSDNNRITVAARLKEELARNPSRLDVATGYLTPSVWTALEGKLAEVRRFRLLLGKDFELTSQARRREVEATIQALVRAALRDELQAQALPTAEEVEAVQGWLELLSRPDEEVDVRVWTDGFLHAKAYILEEAVGVGSANFTEAGLSRNRELVAWRRDASVVRQLQDWFDQLWSQASPYKEELRKILQSSRFGTQEWTPYQVLIRTLADRYGIRRPESLRGAHFTLKWFQEDAVFRLIRLLRSRAGGALLADAVGLGKTFMALGVIHHFIYQSAEERRGRGKPVLVIAPASVRSMWETELCRHNLDWACDVISLESLRSDENLDPYKQCDLVVIDEAHRLRGGRTWFQRAMEIVTEGSEKRVLLVTATPVHTSIRDLTNLLRLLTKNRRNVWAPDIADFEHYLRKVEKKEADPFPLLDRFLVRRSRTDLVRAWNERRAAGVVNEEPLSLPRRRLEHVGYRFDRPDDGRSVFKLFDETVSQLELAPYDLERFRKGKDKGEKSQASDLVGLYLAGLLKRFESSIRAVRYSLLRLDRLLEICARALSNNPPRLPDFHSPQFRQLLMDDLEGDEDAEEYIEARWGAFLQQLQPVAEDYDRDRILHSIEKDRQGVQRLLEALPPEEADAKVEALRALLADPQRLGGQRVLVFTQYRDTARYLYERLKDDSRLGEVALIDGATPSQRRAELTRWFDPGSGLDPSQGPRVLVSTDVLAEGHNLQRASAVVNFDLPWNPQILVQRAGRIDRLNSPHEEIAIVSFVPEDRDFEELLGLIRRLNKRFGLVHYLGLGDEPVTQLRADVMTFTFEELRRLLQQDDTKVLDDIEQRFVLGSTDYMRQPLEAFLLKAGEKALEEIPVGVQSVKYLPRDWRYGSGTFIAFRLGEPGSGETFWRFYPDSGGEPITDEAQIFRAIVCPESEPRARFEGESAGVAPLIDWNLLRRAAEELANEINRRRATAAVLRGASEESRKVRLRLRQLAEVVEEEPPDLTDLLDRLEEVRVEDFDYRPEYQWFKRTLRDAEKAEDAAKRKDLLERVVQVGLELFGRPEGEVEWMPEICPEDLTLVAWERLVPRSTDL